MKRLILAMIAGALFLTVIAASPAGASETIGGCAAEELIHLEEEGIDLVEVYEAKEAGNEEAKKELEEIEEALEDCIEA